MIDLDTIKALIAGRGMAVAEFGRRIGLRNRESISRRLQNKHAITGDELLRMADELGVSADDLRIAS